jgi:fermentation-respiration switch protein FrsA (DUF1100 family)
MMQANLVKLLVAVFFIAYPFIVYFGLSYFPPSFFGLVLMALLAFRYGVIKSDERAVMLPVLLVFLTYAVAMGEFSEDAYKRAEEPKELYYVPNAGHVDLYDKVDLIPFDKLESFFTKHLGIQAKTKS